MKVVRRQEAGEALLDPLRLAQALTLGTVPVAAGIVGRTFVPASVAHVQVSAQRRGATRFDGVHRRTLVGADWVPLPVHLAVGAEDRGDLQGRAGRRATRLGCRVPHGYSGSGAGGKSRRSSGLCVCPICSVLT